MSLARLRRAEGALLALACAWFACTSETAPKRLTLGHGLAPSHPVHEAMRAFGRHVETRSNGRLRVDLYPSEQLCSERECLELLQIGSLDLTKVSAAVLENFAPGYRVLSAPYLFRSDAHRFAVLDGDVGRELLQSSTPGRLRGLAFYDAGHRSFYTRDRAIHTPEDLRGLKIRTQESPTAIAMVGALGGAAAPIAWGELYTALQQGVVDGAENNPPSFERAGHFEVARVYSLDEHTAVPDVLLVSTLLWDRLDADERRWLEASARDSATLQRRLWSDATARALEAVEAAGVEIVRPDKRPFVAATKSVRERMRSDPEVGPLLDRIEATGP